MSRADQPSVTQWNEAQRWFAKAIEDLQVTNLAMSTTPPLVEPAAYHCQQTAEKLFEGLLVASAIDIPRRMTWNTWPECLSTSTANSPTTPGAWQY